MLFGGWTVGLEKKGGGVFLYFGCLDVSVWTLSSVLLQRHLFFKITFDF